MNLHHQKKNREILQGQSLQCQFFISDLNECNDDKFLYLASSLLQSVIAVFFGFRI